VSRTLLPGDRVMVVNRMSSLMGEAGEVKAVLPRVVRVLIDGDDEAVVFHRDELEKLP
jgi:hypothetical protein